MSLSTYSLAHIVLNTISLIITIWGLQKAGRWEPDKPVVMANIDRCLDGPCHPMQPWHGAGDPSLGHRAALGLQPSGIGINHLHGCPSDAHLSGEQAAVCCLASLCGAWSPSWLPCLVSSSPRQAQGWRALHLYGALHRTGFVVRPVVRSLLGYAEMHSPCV